MVLHFEEKTTYIIEKLDQPSTVVRPKYFYMHSLSFIRNVYKERFLVLVKNSKSVRNKLAKSAPLSRKLRNKTSQKKSGNPAQFIPRS